MKRWRWVLTIGAGVVVALLMGGAALVRSVPPLSEQIPPNGAPLVAAINDPSDGGSYPVTGSIPVHGTAVGSAPISRLELWVDGKAYETYAVPISGIYQVQHRWGWTPAGLGDHTLILRVYDSQGRWADSQALHLEAIPEPGFTLLHPAQGGETLAEIAAAYGVDPGTLEAANPDLTTGGPIQAGSEVEIPLPEIQPPPPPKPTDAPHSPDVEADPAAQPPGMDQAFWLADHLLSPLLPQSTPAAPSMTASVSGCGAELLINDHSNSENGFFVYRLGPNEGGFSRIATLGAHPETGPISYTDSNLRGDYQYYASAFNTAGEAVSGILSVSVPDPGCGPLAGNFMLNELVPEADLSDVESFYLYVSPNGQDWSRLPGGDQATLSLAQPVNLSALSAQAPAVVPVAASGFAISRGPAGPAPNIQGEAWGWRGGQLALLGTFNLKAPPGNALANPSSDLLPSAVLEVRGDQVNGTTFERDWALERTYGSIGELHSVKLQWSAPGKVTHGLLQASLLPFGPQADLNPAGLKVTDQAPAPPLYPGKKEFTTDLSAALSQVAPFPTDQGNSSIKLYPPFSPPPDPPQLGGEGNAVAFASPFFWIQPSGGGSNNLVINDQSLAAATDGLPKTVYVRVIPMNGNQVAGKPTGTIRVSVDPTVFPPFVMPPNDIEVPFQVDITDFQPMHFPDSQYEFCLKVISIQQNAASLAGSGAYGSNWAKAKPGDVLCPDKDQGDSSSGLGGFLSDIGDLIEAGVNFVSKLYDDLSEILTDLVDELNPLCQAAKAAASGSSSQKTVEDICHAVASTAVAVAKTYAGIPPSLPNFDELVNMGEDYLIEMAAQEIGFDCGQECKDAIKKGIDLTLDEMKAGQPTPSCSKDAEEAGFKPLCPPDGFEVVTDPRAQYVPAIAQVTLTRPPGPEIVAQAGQSVSACDLWVSDTYTNDFWVGKSSVSLSTPYGKPTIYWEGTELSGRLFVKTAMPIPLVAPGESVSLPVALQYVRGVEYWEGNANPIYYDGPADADPWLPGHKAQWKAAWDVPYVVDWMRDWWMRYHGANITLTASSCGNSDSFKAGPLVMPLIEKTWGSP